MVRRVELLGQFLLMLALPLCTAVQAETFRVATYNLEGYLEDGSTRREPKSAEAKSKISQTILELAPDVLALQEMGGADALEECRKSLKQGGLDFPHWEYVAGFDTNIHLAILSRFPITARRSHTNDSFLLGGRRFHVGRGFGEVEIQVNTNYSFTLLTAHLKSRRPVAAGDESELRLEEAKLLREKVDALFAANPSVNLVVLGDLNDTKDSASTKEIIGRGKHRLVDTRPAERNGDTQTGGGTDGLRNITWTHFFARQDEYSRIDFILLSPGMAREWVTNDTYILTTPNWGLASDHRPLVATFEARDK
jgi:endonuclease/exonuclease/phosphatase family metal-dependent hydrolase